MGSVLEIRNVQEVTIRDTEKVGHYDINEITFDPARSTLLLTGGVPIEIVFSITRLEIHYRSSAKVKEKSSEPDPNGS